MSSNETNARRIEQLIFWAESGSGPGIEKIYDVAKNTPESFLTDFTWRLHILRYIDDVELRQSIEKQLNKIEHAHRFAKAIAFGSSQEITQAEKEDQDISAECRRLIENSVICWNYLYLTHKLSKADKDEKDELLKAIKEGSIIT